MFCFFLHHVALKSFLILKTWPNLSCPFTLWSLLILSFFGDQLEPTYVEYNRNITGFGPEDTRPNKRKIEQRREHVNERERGTTEGGVGRATMTPFCCSYMLYIIRDVSFTYESHQCLCVCFFWNVFQSHQCFFLELLLNVFGSFRNVYFVCFLSPCCLKVSSH